MKMRFIAHGFHSLLFRRTILLTLAFAALVSSRSVAACGQSEPKTVAGVRQAENIWLRALTRKDEPALRCTLSPQFVDTTWQGATHDREQAVAAMKARTGFQQEVKIARVAVDGNTGIAWGMNIIKDPSGRVVMHIAFTDVFRYEKTRWVAVAAEETPVGK